MEAERDFDAYSFKVELEAELENIASGSSIICSCSHMNLELSNCLSWPFRQRINYYRDAICSSLQL